LVCAWIHIVSKMIDVERLNSVTVSYDDVEALKTLATMLAQRAHRLVGHGHAPVLSEGLLTPHLQDRAPRPPIVFDPPVAQQPTARAVY